jgi:hypothetical protein
MTDTIAIDRENTSLVAAGGILVGVRYAGSGERNDRALTQRGRLLARQ